MGSVEGFDEMMESGAAVGVRQARIGAVLDKEGDDASLL
jgi:hypothetical protein